MPYLLLDSFTTFCLSGIEASGVEVLTLAAAVTELGFDCVGSCPPSVCWFAFCLYTDLCALMPGTLVYLSVNLLNI